MLDSGQAFSVYTVWEQQLLKKNKLVKFWIIVLFSKLN